jgi:hypothetical protein
VPALSFAQRRNEFLVAPNAGVAIGSDIGSKNVAEGRFDRSAAGKRRSTWLRVASRTIGRGSQIATAFEFSEILCVCLNGTSARHALIGSAVWFIVLRQVNVVWSGLRKSSCRIL